ncbi:PadR family transcriptional regulator [Nocardioides nitrophenolicus]|uniref:PadR family transcriptional regulator n=1 Tax=Nocardioides nitrophenolicus TaxID=60489 RepID=UPI00195BB0E4|nr:PadR family transcriptional regulator [Nocardioides nitrophenolicus]MBM7517922.1 DNA-binding PadR family transcriptional regulator [Nocardioides nitrophenolicus]
MELTPAELTVLGLVVEQPRHGYDLEQVIEQRGIRQWTEIGFSSIYYLLAKLEKRGLLSAEEAGGGAKSRRVFRATRQGRQVATDGALAFIADGRTVPQPVLVGLANLALVAERDYDQALSSRLTRVEARIASVTEAQRSQTPLPPAAREVFSYSLSLLEAERSWLVARVRGGDE